MSASKNKPPRRYTIRISEKQRDLLATAIGALDGEAFTAADESEMIQLEAMLDDLAAAESENPGIIHCFA